MRNLLLVTLVGAALAGSSVLGQGLPFQPRPIRFTPSPASRAVATNLPRFNLDFAGGTPQQLVDAIEKASGKPLNVVIPRDMAEVRVPPIRLSEVTVPQLFEALQAATTILVQSDDVTIAFQTVDRPATQNSIWFLPNAAPPASIKPAITCRYYQLAPYLASTESGPGYTVEDITTAIETGWKMLGVTSPPKLKFHKEPKLLIAAGDPKDLRVIDDVLKQLKPTARGEAKSTSPKN